MMTYSCNSSTQEVEAGGLPGGGSKFGLSCEFQDCKVSLLSHKKKKQLNKQTNKKMRFGDN